jgi:hypothetical protein
MAVTDDPIAAARRWRRRHYLETVAIGLLILMLTVVTVVVADRVYRAGLAVLSRSGEPVLWLWRTGEAGFVLVLALAAGGWLTGAWLGEREPRAWAGLGLVIAALAAPLLLLLNASLGATEPASRYAPPGLTPGSLWLVAPAVVLAGLAGGGLLGAWWVGVASPASES